MERIGGILEGYKIKDLVQMAERIEFDREQRMILCSCCILERARKRGVKKIC